MAVYVLVRNEKIIFLRQEQIYNLYQYRFKI